MRDRLAADAAEFGREVLGLLDARNFVARSAAVVGDQALAVSDLLGRCGIEVNVGEQIGIGFGLKESGERRDLRIVEAIVRHCRARIVGTRVSQPGLQPFRLDLASDAGQFGANVAADHVSSGILHGVARGAERFSVEAGAGGGIGGAFAASVAVSPGSGVLLAIRNADMSRASSSLSLKFGMVDVEA